MPFFIFVKILKIAKIDFGAIPHQINQSKKTAKTVVVIFLYFFEFILLKYFSNAFRIGND
jgi:hypothetical protein